MKWIALVPVAVASGLAVMACGATEPVSPEPPVVGSGNTVDVAAQGGRDSGANATSSGGGSFGDDPTCSRSLVAVDPGALPVCAGGKGHCYDKDKTPNAVTLDECDATHWCVPNAVFAAGKLKSCNSGVGPGACASTLIHEVAERADDLSTTGCDDGDLCVPCTNSATGQATFACNEVGLYDKVCAPGTEVDSGPPGLPPDAGPPPPIVLDECCPNVDFAGNALPSGGTCIPNGQLPAQQAAELEQKTCNQNFTCAPTELYNGGQGNGAFASCEWDAPWSFGGNGVCLDNCFLTAEQHAELNENEVESDGCGPTKRCVPCGEDGVPESTPGCF